MIENRINRENGFTMNKVTCSCDLRNYLFAIVSLLVVLLLIYGNSFFGEWHFDDFNNIVDNRAVHVKGLSWEEFQKTFYGVSYGTERERISRPLAYLSFGLNYFFGGTEVFGYHVVNFFIHWITSIFLFLFIHKTLKLPLLRERYGQSAYAIALLSTFLWATSPLQVNAVTIIVQRMTSLAGLGYVMALYFYLRARMAEGTGRRGLYFFLCLLSAILAVGSKENALMLPISILLYDIMLIQGVTRVYLLRMLKYTWIPMTVLVLLALLYADPSRLMNSYSVRPFTLIERLLTEPRILIFYITLLLYPIPSRLTLLHDIDISRSLIDPWTTLPALLAVGLFCLAAVAMARRKPLLSYCMLFFILNHLIEGTIIPLELIFEHRNYIPSMLFFVPIAVLMVRCLDYFSYRRAFQVFMAGGFGLLLAFQGHTTFERNDVVRSDVHLWLDNVRKAPNLSRPHINLSKHYYEAGMYGEAFRELKTAEDLNRDTNLRQASLASYGLGIYYLYQAKDMDRAEQQFVKTLEKYPGYPSAVVGLAKIRLKKGDLEGAWGLMVEHVPRHHNHAEMINCYALVLLKKRNASEALKAAARSMELNWNDPQPRELSGEAWRQLGHWQKAAQCWEDALRLNPANPRALLALLELYDRLKDKPAIASTAARCMVLKNAKPLDEWLAEFTENSGITAYEVNPGMLGRIIRREIRRELAQKK